MREHTFTIGMDYPGMSLSKNHLWKGGNRRYGMNDEAKQWKSDLANSVRMVLFIDGILSPGPPVSVQISARFLDANHAVDLHNLAELVNDAVEEGTGINDRHFAFSTLQPAYDAHQLPAVWVTVSVSYEGVKA